MHLRSHVTRGEGSRGGREGRGDKRERRQARGEKGKTRKVGRGDTKEKRKGRARQGGARRGGWHVVRTSTLPCLCRKRMGMVEVGGYWSRFSSFVTGPGAVLRYVRNPTSHGSNVGHNPLGSLSVLALLFFLLLQVIAGLMSDD